MITSGWGVVQITRNSCNILHFYRTRTADARQWPCWSPQQYYPLFFWFGHSGCRTKVIGSLKQDNKWMEEVCWVLSTAFSYDFLHSRKLVPFLGKNELNLKVFRRLNSWSSLRSLSKSCTQISTASLGGLWWKWVPNICLSFSFKCISCTALTLKLGLVWLLLHVHLFIQWSNKK